MWLKSKKGKVIAAVCLTAVILLTAGIIYGLNHDPSGNKSGIQLDKNAVQYSAGKSAPAEQTSISFPGYPDITIKSTEQKIPIVLVNPEGNPCYFKFEAVLTETEEILLESGWVEPGKAIEGIALEKALQPGNYQLEIHISTRSLDNGEAMNGGNIKTSLFVKE